MSVTSNKNRPGFLRAAQDPRRPGAHALALAGTLALAFAQEVLLFFPFLHRFAFRPADYRMHAR